MERDREQRLEAALARALRGEETAFAEIIREHQSMVFSIAWHYLGDRSLAEDVAQEVFLELYQRLATIHSAAHLTFWLRRVAVHRSFDQGRKRQNRREQEMDAIAEPSAERSGSDVMLHQRLRQTLGTLPERQRMVLVLRYQEDLGPGEIAELMNIPVNTVKSTLHRTLEEVRKRMVRKIGEARYAFF